MIYQLTIYIEEQKVPYYLQQIGTHSCQSEIWKKMQSDTHTVAYGHTTDTGF